jgi:hypothetical protein
LGLRQVISSRFPRLTAAFCNCGGMNRRGSRFAGRLLKSNLSDEEYEAICHSLVMPNGVRKTTVESRNTELLRRLWKSEQLPLANPISVLDVGAGFGLDALSTWQFLSEHVDVERYVLADNYTHLLYEPARQLVFDQDHNLLQVSRGSGFVSIHFSYNYAFQKITYAGKRVLPARLKRKYEFDPVAEIIRIPIVTPRIQLNGKSPFELRRMNVFETVHGQFDLIVCMHLLVNRYFSPNQIQVGIRNLSASLAPKGILVVGALDNYQVISR